MQELSDFLTARGYARIALRRSLVGHFHTDGMLNGRPVEVLVDTGASCTVVASTVVEALGLRTESLDAEASGAGGPMDQRQVFGAELRLGTFVPTLANTVALDFTHVNAPLRAQGSTEVDMILGSDVFDTHDAVLDYGSHALFLRVPASD